ncbi:zinc-binding dehydrogenase [soil metagenome]
MIGRHIAYFERKLELLEGDVPPPPPGAVVARVTMAGVCGTDAHRLAGEVKGPDEPISLGHESVGVLVELGEGVTADFAGSPISVGDRIAWLPGGGCHRCHACVTLQNENICENIRWPVVSTLPNGAGYRDYATLLDGDIFYRVDDDTPDEAVVALGCALPTALGLMERLGRIAPGQSIVVQGSGPVGLSATLLAAQSSASKVILIGTGEDRLAWGTTFGATHIIDIETTTPEQRLAEVLELTEGLGADIVLEGTGFIDAFTEGIAMLGKHGRYVIAGLYAGDKTVPFNPVLLNNRNLEIIGSYFGRASHRREALAIVAKLHKDVNLSAMVTHRFPLDKTEEAINLMASGHAVKVVVVP